MADLDLTQAEADALVAMEKFKADDQRWLYPEGGGAIHIPLVSGDKRETFFIDVTRSSIALTKGSYQCRGRQVVVLLRLCFGGAGHRNPDDQDVPCPHLHTYREGYGDKWAEPLPRGAFSRPSDPWETLIHFMTHCNVVERPIIDRGLFS